jgi:hypothetical protein
MEATIQGNFNRCSVHPLIKSTAVERVGVVFNVVRSNNHADVMFVDVAMFMG